MMCQGHRDRKQQSGLALEHPGSRAHVLSHVACRTDIRLNFSMCKLMHLVPCSLAFVGRTQEGEGRGACRGRQPAALTWDM